jgi:hypothetical protein
MATVIRTTGERREVDPADLETLQKAVGGYIEEVHVPDGRVMFVNEDGRSLNLPENLHASILAGQRIVGDAVLLTKAETDAAKRG